MSAILATAVVHQPPQAAAYVQRRRDLGSPDNIPTVRRPVQLCGCAVDPDHHDVVEHLLFLAITFPHGLLPRLHENAYRGVKPEHSLVCQHTLNVGGISCVAVDVDSNAKVLMGLGET